jgi:hypothetical protein
LKNIAKNKYIKYEVTYYKDKNDFLEYLIWKENNGNWKVLYFRKWQWP